MLSINANMAGSRARSINAVIAVGGDGSREGDSNLDRKPQRILSSIDYPYESAKLLS